MTARPPTQGVLARAESWSAMIDGRAIRTRADLARHLGVSRARVTQALAVLNVPDLLLNTLRRAEVAGTPLTESEWRKIKGLPAERVASLLEERMGCVVNREHGEQGG